MGGLFTTSCLDTEGKAVSTDSLESLSGLSSFLQLCKSTLPFFSFACTEEGTLGAHLLLLLENDESGFVVFFFLAWEYMNQKGS